MRPTLRTMFRHPALSATIVATLAVGIGIATALFVYLDLFLHPRIAAPQAARVVSVYFGTADDPRQSASFAELTALRGNPALHDAIGASPIGAALGAAEGNHFADGNRFAWGHSVSGNFFTFFGARPALGRLLTDADDAAGAPAVVVLGYGVWQDDFGGDPGVLGRALRVNGELLTVVGVAARDFTGVGYAAGFFVPLAAADRIAGVQRHDLPEERWLRVYARLPEGLSAEAASATLAALAAGLDRSAPLADGARRSLLLPATGFDPESANDPYYHAARALTGAALLFLLLGSANVAGLLLAGTAAREREWAVRKALGASPRRLLAALAGEIALPALVGAAGGLLVALAVVRWLEGMMLTPVGGIGPGWTAPGSRLLELDGRALAFALAASALTVLTALVPPTLRLLRDDPNRALRSGDARAGARLGLRRALVTLELALAVVLLVGGGLLARSLAAAAHADLGFSARGLLQATLYLPRSAGTPATTKAWSAMLDATRRLPAVSAAAVAHVAPNTGMSRATRVAAVETADALRDTRYNIVSAGYFETLGIPLLSGRAFDVRDAPGSPAAAVVNRALAERLFGSAPAVGRRVRVAGTVRAGDAGPDFEIVGVAADAATTSAIEPHEPTLFFAYGQRTHARMTLLARSASPLSSVEPQLRQALASAAPQAAIIDLASSDEQQRRTLHPMRINATLAEGLAGLSLVTALAGLVALQIFGVSLRRRELGIRAALGAERGALGRLVLGEGLRLGLLGAAAGVAGALAATRALRSMLFGVDALDPWTLALVPLVLLTAVLLAGWIPARRAMRTDPAESLRTL